MLLTVLGRQQRLVGRHLALDLEPRQRRAEGRLVLHERLLDVAAALDLLPAEEQVVERHEHERGRLLGGLGRLERLVALGHGRQQLAQQRLVAQRLAHERERAALVHRRLGVRQALESALPQLQLVQQRRRLLVELAHRSVSYTKTKMSG